MTCCTPKIFNLSGSFSPIQPTNIDLIQDPANPHTLTVVFRWLDQNGDPQVLADGTPITIPDGASGIDDVLQVGQSFSQDHNVDTTAGHLRMGSPTNGQEFFFDGSATASQDQFRVGKSPNTSTGNRNGLYSNAKITGMVNHDSDEEASVTVTNGNATIFTRSSEPAKTAWNFTTDRCNVDSDVTYEFRWNGDRGNVGEHLTSLGANRPIWGAASDKRIKSDFKKIDNATKQLSQIEVLTFRYYDETPRKVGVVAQQIAEILPDLVRSDQSSVDVDGNPITDFHTVDYQSLFSLALQAIKELNKRVEVLESA